MQPTTDSTTFAALSLGTGELTAGSVNRTAGTFTVEISGVAVGSFAATGLTLTGSTDDGSTSVQRWLDSNLAEVARLNTDGELFIIGDLYLGNDANRLVIGSAIVRETVDFYLYLYGAAGVSLASGGAIQASVTPAGISLDRLVANDQLILACEVFG